VCVCVCVCVCGMRVWHACVARVCGTRVSAQGSWHDCGTGPPGLSRTHTHLKRSAVQHVGPRVRRVIWGSNPTVPPAVCAGGAGGQPRGAGGDRHVGLHDRGAECVDSQQKGKALCSFSARLRSWIERACLADGRGACHEPVGHDVQQLTRAMDCPRARSSDRAAASTTGPDAWGAWPSMLLRKAAVPAC
jgi:hypothetical protein